MPDKALHRQYVEPVLSLSAPEPSWGVGLSQLFDRAPCR